jgi:hypothetical protein
VYTHSCTIYTFIYNIYRYRDRERQRDRESDRESESEKDIYRYIERERERGREGGRESTRESRHRPAIELKCNSAVAVSETSRACSAASPA